MLNTTTDLKPTLSPPKLSEIIWGITLPNVEIKCVIDLVTPWLSFDSPTGDNGTGDHELMMEHNFCGDRSPEIIDVREISSHLPYYVRNLVFHQGYRNKFYLGPSRHYGLR